MKKQTIIYILAFLIGLFGSFHPLTGDSRLKDIAAFEGVRDNQLIGYGIIVGLEGTGDTTQNKFTFQSMANLLDKMGLKLDPNAFQMRNTAAVAVTATLPPFPVWVPKLTSPYLPLVVPRAFKVEYYSSLP